MTTDVGAVLDQVVERLRGASSVLFVTGAGISADSGIPTYRGIGGLYQDASTEEGLPIEEALSGHMMSARPAVTWKYLHQIEAACRGAKYNRAHEVLAAVEDRLDRVWILTQNVDGFHRDAGSRNVIEIHGNIHDIICTACEFRDEVSDFSGLEACPTCGDCGAVVRPDVVLFGELLPFEKVAQIEEELTTGFDVVFSIGTTSLFPYIVRPLLEAKVAGKITLEINPGETTLSGQVDFKLPMGAAEACQALWARFDAR